MKLDKNPKLPEDINVSSSNLLLELAQLSVGAVVVFGLIAILLWKSLAMIAGWVPIEWENRWTTPFITVQKSEQQAHLQQRMNIVLAAMDQDEVEAITVHYVINPEPNAFATLGANVFINSALYEKLTHVEALDLVLAHEAAHIVKRDPIKTFAPALGLQFFSLLVFGSADSPLLSSLADSGSGLAILRYSREVESRADELALDSLKNIHEDILPARQLFEVLAALEASDIWPDFVLTHPHMESRLAYFDQQISN